MVSLFKKKKRVILDTNMLLMPGKGLDVFSAIENALDISFQFYTMQGSYDELEKLVSSSKKGSDKFNAKLGYIMAKQKGLKTIDSPLDHVDDAIVEQATSQDYVATMDKKLQKRIRDKGAKLIVVKNRNQVEIK